MAEESKMICSRCNQVLEMRELTFSYLGKNGTLKTPRCPACGRVYVSEALREGYVQKLEYFLEEASLQGGRHE